MRARQISANGDVQGVGLDDESRCIHFHGPADIVAIRFKCCGEFYACKDCHSLLADHPVVVWPEHEWEQEAIRCGSCRTLVTIREYLQRPPQCPACGAAFNPRCRNHHHFYFDVPGSEPR